jgi:hypothetical protein
MKKNVVDAENEDSIQSAFKETRDLVGPPGLNVLVNNAAINLKKESIIDINAEDLLKTFKVNVVGPAIISKVGCVFLYIFRKLSVLTFSRLALLVRRFLPGLVTLFHSKHLSRFFLIFAHPTVISLSCDAQDNFVDD